jgi:hypothetical protein
MENLYDYKKFAILYVDDEEKSLKYFTRVRRQFRMLTATAQDGSSCSNSTPMKSAC